MSIEVVTTAYGPPAHDALAKTVEQAKGGDPLAPVTVVVPNHYVGLTAHRALGGRSVPDARGVAAVDFVTPYGLAERLGGAALAAQGRPGVSNAVIAGAVRTILEDRPGHFEGVAGHPATIQLLAGVHKELSELDDNQLNSLARQSKRARDVVRVHRSATQALARHFSNEQDLVAAAETAVTTNPRAARHKLGQLIVFLPQRVTNTQARLLRRVADAVQATCIVGTTGADDADAAVMASLERLGLSLVDDAAATPLPHIRGLSVSDADEEVRHALRAIVEAAGRGTPLGRCAIVYGTRDPYASLVCNALDTAGIERCGASPSTAANSWLGRNLLSLLALRDASMPRRNVMAWLADARVRISTPDEDGSSGRRPVPVAAWERVARAARVTGGIDDWRRRLDAYSQDCRVQADRIDERDDEHSRRQQLLRRADHTEQLARFVDELHNRLNPESPPRNWRDATAWCRGLVGDYLGGNARNRWPDDEQQMAAAVDAAIDRLADLDLLDNSPSTQLFRQALQLELESAEHRHGRLGAGVLVGTVQEAIGIDFELLVVCGMAEGSLPSRHRESALLPDSERLSTDGGLPLLGDRSGDDHRALLAVLASTPRALLLYPRGDLRQAAPRSPSRWLLDIVESLDGKRPGAENLTMVAGEWLTEVSSFVSSLQETSFPAHVQEYDICAALRWHDRQVAPPGSRSLTSQDRALLCSDVFSQRSHLQRGVELRLGRESDDFTRFDGNLAAGDLRGTRLPRPTDKTEVVSASWLEDWIRCPHAYFVKRVLAVRAVEDDADAHRISTLDRGQLVHRILERWVAEAIETGQAPAHGQPWSDTLRQRLIAIGEEECDRVEAQGLVGRRTYWRSERRRTLADLERFVDFDDQIRGERSSRPIAVELAFGLSGSAAEPVEIKLGSGETLRLRGSIDRLDETAESALMVIDYKTGSTRDFEDLKGRKTKPAGRLRLDGLRLQLDLYALAARSLRNDRDIQVMHLGDSVAYWFVSRRGGFKSLGYQSAEVRQDVMEAVALIADGIGDGVFPLRPEEPDDWRTWVPCAFCDPDGLGTGGGWRDWQRKREHHRSKHQHARSALDMYVEQASLEMERS